MEVFKTSSLDVLLSEITEDRTRSCLPIIYFGQVAPDEMSS